MKSRITGWATVFTVHPDKTAGQPGSRRGTSPATSRRTIRLVVMLLVILEILDAVITNRAITAGIVREGNPLLTQIADGWNFILLKTIGAGLSGITLLVLHKHFPRLSLAAAAIIAIYYTLVLAWNSGLAFSNWLTL